MNTSFHISLQYNIRNKIKHNSEKKVIVKQRHACMHVTSRQRRFNHLQTSVADPSLRVLTSFIGNTGMSEKEKEKRK